MTVDITTKTTQRSEVQVTQISETGESTMPTLREVSSAPVFLSPLRSFSTSEGSSACFRCSISAEPPPQVTWFLEGEVLHDPELYFFDSSHHDYSLLIHEAFTEDAGVYECHATNPHGVASSVARLTIIPAGVCKLIPLIPVVSCKCSL